MDKPKSSVGIVGKNLLSKIFIFFVCLCFWQGSLAFAYNFLEQKPTIGMKNLKPKSPDTSMPTQTQGAPELEKPIDTDLSKPIYVPLKPEDALIKIDDLEEWNHLSEVALAESNQDIKKIIYLIESDRGSVPPQGLILAAKSLFDKGLKEQAALYFIVGQLRLSFDTVRWPSTPNKNDVKRLGEDSKKTSDQSAPNLDKEPRIDDPHQGLKNLTSGLGEPIISWMIKDTRRMNMILNKARDWDVSTPYAYLPNYSLNDPVPFEKWPKLLTRVRESYFSEMTKMVKAMERVKN